MKFSCFLGRISFLSGKHIKWAMHTVTIWVNFGLCILKDFQIIFVSSKCCSFIFVGEQSRVRLLDPEDGGTMLLQNIRTYSPNNAWSHSNWLESSSDNVIFGAAITVIILLSLNTKVILCSRSPVLICCSLRGLLRRSWCWDFRCLAESSNWEIQEELLDFRNQQKVKECKDLTCKNLVSGDTMRWGSVTCHGISRRGAKWSPA